MSGEIERINFILVKLCGKKSTTYSIAEVVDCTDELFCVQTNFYLIKSTQHVHFKKEIFSLVVKLDSSPIFGSQLIWVVLRCEHYYNHQSNNFSVPKLFSSLYWFLLFFFFINHSYYILLFKLRY